MKCKSVRELAGPYIYGDLTPEEMNAVRTHTQHCEECRQDIRSQMAIVSALPNSAPVLNDEDRQRIAWTVKGAVKAAEPEPRLRWFRFSPAYALAAIVIIGMIGIKVVSSISTPPVVQEKAKVTVTEVPIPQPVNKEKVVDRPKHEENALGAQNTAEAPEGAEPENLRSGDGHRLLDEFSKIRARLPVGTFTHRNRQGTPPAVVPPEPPAPVIDAPVTPDVRVDNDEGKLPEPTDVNDARTTPLQPSQTNGTESNNDAKTAPM